MPMTSRKTSRTVKDSHAPIPALSNVEFERCAQRDFENSPERSALHADSEETFAAGSSSESSSASASDMAFEESSQEPSDMSKATDSFLTRARKRLSGLKAFYVRLREAAILTGNLTGSGIRTHTRDGRSALVDRFAGVLSTLYWEPQRKVFLLNGGGDTSINALGAVFELNSLIYADSAVVQGLERLFAAAWPKDTVIATTLFASSAVRGTLSDYVESRRRVLESERDRQALNPVSAAAGFTTSDAASTTEAAFSSVPWRMALERARKFDAMARIPSERTGCVREFRVWMSVTTRVGESAVEDFLSGRRNEAIDAFFLALQAVESTLTQLTLFRCRWNDRIFTQTMRELVNPQKQRAGLVPPPTEPAAMLREGLVRRDTMIDVEKNHITVSSAAGDAVDAVSLTVAGYPAQANVNRMRGVLAQASFAYPYLFTCAVEPTSVADDRAVIAMKNARVKQLMHTEIGQFLTDLGERSRDFDLAQQACEEGSGLARMLHAMTVFAPRGEAMAAAQKAGNVLARAGFDAQVSTGLQMMGLLFNLPLEASHGLMLDARAARQTSTKTRRAAAHLIPVMAESRGSPARAGVEGAAAAMKNGNVINPANPAISTSTPSKSGLFAGIRTPMLMLVTRRGQLLPIDIFANRSGNFNAVIAGTSGSGKSVLAQEIVLSQIGLGGRVWVFDIGKSYKNCMELVSGQFIDFDRSRLEDDKAGNAPDKVEKQGAKTGKDKDSRKPLCLNPLDMLEDPAEMLDELAQIVTVMANGDAPMELTQAELLKLYIDRVVREARQKGETPTMTTLALALMNAGDAGLSDLAVRLMPYCAGGRYGHWFEGPSTIDFERALVVLEMEALTNKPTLQNAVLLIVIMRILKEIRRRPRAEKKLIVIDEAWRLLTGNSGRFIEWACRTLRKYGAGIVCISQSMSDFDATSAARAVRMNADSVFLLRQKPAGIASYTSDPGLTALLSSLTTRAGDFSEVYVKVGDQPGVVARLMLDSFSMTAYSTKAEVFDAVQNARARGLPIEEAVVAVSRMNLEGGAA